MSVGAGVGLLWSLLVGVAFLPAWSAEAFPMEKGIEFMAYAGGGWILFLAITSAATRFIHSLALVFPYTTSPLSHPEETHDSTPHLPLLSSDWASRALVRLKKDLKDFNERVSRKAPRVNP